MDGQRKWFLKIKSTPGGDAVKVVEMTTKDLEYYINFFDKVLTICERIEGSSTAGKMLSISLAFYRAIIRERKSQLVWKTSLLSHLKKLPQVPKPSATAALISQPPSTLRQDPPPAKRIQLAESSDD
ncbi:hypothetical protein PANDA_017538, partial [Ailuropoda melanoleuca]